jgi:hypothetical protein
MAPFVTCQSEWKVKKEEGNMAEPLTHHERHELSLNSSLIPDPASPSHLSEPQVDNKPEDRNLLILAEEVLSPSKRSKML